MQGVATITANTPVKKLPCSLACSQRAAGAGEREPDFKLAGEREAHKKEQPRHQCQEDRRLELKSPAQRGAGRAQTQQHAHQHPERNQNAGCVNESVGAQFVLFLVAGVDQSQPLEKEHRENTWHQVEQQPAEKRKCRSAQQHKPRKRGRRRDHRARHRRQLIRSAIGELENADQPRGTGGEVGVLFEIEYDTPGRGRGFLRGGVGKNVLIDGEKRGSRFAVAGINAEAEAVGCVGWKTTLTLAGSGVGKRACQALHQFRIGAGTGDDVGLAGDELQRGRELRLAGNADFAADQPIDLRVNNGFAVFTVGATSSFNGNRTSFS